MDSGWATGAAMGDTDGDGEEGITGNGAVDGWGGAARPALGCPQTGQNRDPGGTGCPHAGLPEPVTPAIVTAG